MRGYLAPVVVAILLPAVLLSFGMALAQETVPAAGAPAPAAANQPAPSTDGKAAPPEAGCAEAETGGYTLCLGLEALSIDGEGDKLRPYGDLDTHAMVRGRYLGLKDYGLLDLGFVYNGASTYDLNADLHGDTYIVHLEAFSAVHNLGRFDLPRSAGTSAMYAFTSDDQDPSADYKVEFGDLRARVKVKPFNYPAHVSATVRRFTNEGDRQQVFLDENCSTGCHLVSQKRSVKTTTDQMEFAADGHFGYVDVAYRMKATSFADDKSDPTFAYGPLGAYGGTREHNVYPDLKATEQMVNLSTVTTGALSGAVSLALGKRENDNLSLKENYRRVYGQAMYRSGTSLSLLLDAQQYSVQDDPPPAGSSVEASRVSDGVPLEYGSVENRARAVMAYHPNSSLDVSGEFVRSEIEREDNAAWGLPDRTASSQTKVTARYKPSGVFSLKALLGTTSTEDPPYATSPTDDTTASLGAQWAVRPNLQVGADIKSQASEREDSGRTSERRFINGTVSYSPSPPVVLSLYVLSFADDVDTDLTFDGPGLSVVLDEDVSYSAKGSHLLFQASWSANENLRLNGDLSYLSATGDYQADQSPFADVDDYSGLDVVSQELALGFFYRISADMDLTGRLARMNYDDDRSPDAEETVNSAFAAVTKRW